MPSFYGRSLWQKWFYSIDPKSTYHRSLVNHGMIAVLVISWWVIIFLKFVWLVGWILLIILFYCSLSKAALVYFKTRPSFLSWKAYLFLNQKCSYAQCLCSMSSNFFWRILDFSDILKGKKVVLWSVNLDKATPFKSKTPH